MQKKSVIKFILLLLAILFFVYLFHYSPWASSLTYNTLQTFVSSFGGLSWIVFILLYGLLSMLSVPGTILTLTGGLLFGKWLGFVLNLTGAVLGCSIAFFVARLLGRDFVEGLLKGKLSKLERIVEKNGFKGILFIRLIPLFPFNGVNYASGLLNLRFKDYFLGSGLGMIPGTFVYTYLFATVGESVLKEGLSWQALLQPEIIIAIILFALLITMPLAYKRNRRKK